MSYENSRVILTKPPTEESSARAKTANIAVRSLNKSGLESDLSRFSSMMKDSVSGDIVARIKAMNRVYQVNSQQAVEYDAFLAKLWEIGKGDQQLAQLALKQMLESPEMSQRLLSAFFYYDP